MKNVKRFMFVVACFLIPLLLSGCGGGDSWAVPFSKEQKVLMRAGNSIYIVDIDGRAERITGLHR